MEFNKGKLKRKLLKTESLFSASRQLTREMSKTDHRKEGERPRKKTKAYPGKYIASMHYLKCIIASGRGAYSLMEIAQLRHAAAFWGAGCFVPGEGKGEL